jgi:metallophosphoesterase superfamily enzyme
VIVWNDWLLTPQRAAVHLPSDIAVVADLHLGYDQARRRGGDAVPGVSVADQLAPLGSALARHGARRLAVAGDLLEDGRCHEALTEFQAWLGRAGIELVGIAPGNHDQAALVSGAGGLPVYPEGLQVGGWRIVHGDGPTPGGPVVQGHEHPWVRWKGGIGGPCYLVGEGRLVLPAYSADAAGVNVRGVRRWRAFRCCVIAGGRVLDFGPVGDLPRRP